VGVVRDGRLERFHGHGLADIASKTPITEDTVFRIGSITKTFTAIALMQLWERGLSTWMPGQRLSARLPADPREGELPARHGAPATDSHGRDP
jgi:CubicO group peptidase (beta-lactamase class C family)